MEGVTMKEKKGTLGWLIEFAGPHKELYIASVITAVIGIASGLLPYFAVAQMIISLIAGTMERTYYLTWCGVAAFGFLIKILGMNLSTTFSHKATFAVISEVRHQLASKLSRVPMGYVLDTPSGKFKTTMVERVDGIETPLAHVIPEMTSNLLVPIGIIIYLFTLDWRMAMVSLITLPIGFVAYMGMMKDYAVKYEASTNAGKHMSATVVEYINGIEVIKAFNQSANSYAKFSDAVKKNTRFTLDWMRSTQIYSAIAQSVWPAVLIGVLPAGCLFYMNSSLDAPVFITIMILSLGIIGPIIAAMMFTDDIAKISTVVGDIGRILGEPDMVRPEKEAALKGKDIELRNVTFGYKDTQVLKGVNLTIEAGSVTALVGPSGGGKSTIAKLIASLWDVDDGEIIIGSVNIRDIPTEQLMDTVAYVAQDNYLFNDTVRNNIRMGKQGATDAEVEAVARASGCHDFIMNLENGYETVAGGAGGHLSGGERQRISIARAMLKNAPVIILDEATAYTDPENEAIIQEAVSKLVVGKTLIVIAHRLSTVIDSDKIVVIQDGKAAAEGTHSSLLSTSSLYNNLWHKHMEGKDSVKEDNAL